MEGERSRVFRSGNRTGKDKARERKGKRSLGVADTKMYQRCSEVLGTGQLLSLVHRRFCNGGKAII